MKIAIISDSHDNLVNLKKALIEIKKFGIKVLIHSGDLSSPAALEELVKNFQGQIYWVFGNGEQGYFFGDDPIFKKFKNVKIYKEMGEIKIEKQKIGFAHFPPLAKKLAQSGKYELVFYGHTHKPWLEKIGSCQLVNPGNLAGLFYKATFAVYDSTSGRLELKILEGLN